MLGMSYGRVETFPTNPKKKKTHIREREYYNSRQHTSAGQFRGEWDLLNSLLCIVLGVFFSQFAKKKITHKFRFCSLSNGKLINIFHEWDTVEKRADTRHRARRAEYQMQRTLFSSENEDQKKTKKSNRKPAPIHLFISLVSASSLFTVALFVLFIIWALN